MWPCGTKANHICAADGMLDGGFVAKASSIKPRPSLLYLDGQMKGRNVKCMDIKGTMYSFMSPKLTRELGLANAWSAQTH
jgi:hypothetical protein